MEEEPEKLGKDETALYDRAIRVWGEEVQKRYTFSTILLF